MKHRVVLFALLAVGLAAAGGYIYFFDSADHGEARSALSANNAIPPGALSVVPVSDKVNFETQRAALEAFAKRQDREPVQRYLSDLREVVLDGKGAFYLQTFASLFPRFGVSRDERDAYMASFKTLSTPELRAIQGGWRNQQRQRSMPFDFSAPTLAGENFDLDSLRGKLVLVDFWDTGCSACINAMPLIEASYKKYGSKGFEVVSVVSKDSLGNLDLEAVKRIERETGATWPYKLNGSEQWQKIAATYAFPGNPQYMLLDREGRLIAETGEVDLGRNLDALLKKHL